MPDNLTDMVGDLSDAALNEPGPYPNDMLSSIMADQNAFQSSTPDGVRRFDQYVNPVDLMAAIRTQTLACTDELHEALGETGWKPWASSNHINLLAFRSELIDAFRFWLNLVHIAGMSPEDVYDGYLTSLAKTTKRVDDGYDGVTTKCPGCKRAYDDTGAMCRPPDKSYKYRYENSISWCSVHGFVRPSGEPMVWSSGNGGWILRETT